MNRTAVVLFVGFGKHNLCKGMLVIFASNIAICTIEEIKETGIDIHCSHEDVIENKSMELSFHRP